MGVNIVSRDFARVQCKLCDAEEDLFRVDDERDGDLATRVERVYGRAALESEKKGWVRPFDTRHRYPNIHETWLCPACLGVIKKREVKT